jgi:hypothetical protein
MWLSKSESPKSESPKRRGIGLVDIRKSSGFGLAARRGARHNASHKMWLSKMVPHTCFDVRCATNCFVSYRVVAPTMVTADTGYCQLMVFVSPPIVAEL